MSKRMFSQTGGRAKLHRSIMQENKSLPRVGGPIAQLRHFQHDRSKSPPPDETRVKMKISSANRARTMKVSLPRVSIQQEDMT